jgi:hypothetical protein
MDIPSAEDDKVGEMARPSMFPGGLTSGARVQASTVRVRDRFALAQYGAAAQQKLREASSKALLETFATAGDRWVDFAQFIESTELVCKLFNAGDITLARAIGRFGAEANMGLWRSIVFKVLAPGTVLGIAGGLWNHHYSGGRLVPRGDGEHAIRVRIEDFPAPHRTHCLSIEGWIQRTIELGKPKHVMVSELLCRLRGDDACEFRADWE